MYKGRAAVSSSPTTARPERRLQPGLWSGFLQTFQCEVIRLAPEVLFERGVEERFILGRPCKQRHTRSKLQVVGSAKDLPDRAALDLACQLGALLEARAENGVREIGSGLVERSNAVVTRHPAVAQASELGEYKPHPVALFTSRA